MLTQETTCRTLLSDHIHVQASALDESIKDETSVAQKIVVILLDEIAQSRKFAAKEIYHLCSQQEVVGARGNVIRSLIPGYRCHNIPPKRI